MEIRETSLAGIPLLAVTGEIDHSTADEFDAAVRGNLRGGDRLFLDLAACPYLDSGGLAVLLSLVREARPGGWVGIIAPSPDLVRLLEIVGLSHDPHFRVFSSLEEAGGFAKVAGRPATP